MKIEILHLSDLHFKANDTIPEQQQAALVAAVRGTIGRPCKLLVLIAGDIAFSGRKVEFDAALPILQRLLTDLTTTTGVEEVKVFIVPGNHDCDFSGEAAARKLILREIGGGTEWDPSVPKLTTAVQEQFRLFTNTLLGRPDIDALNGLVGVERIDAGEKPLAIWSVNSSWMSQLREVPGNIWFPVHQLQDELESSEAAFNILVMHHPLAWFQPETRRAFQTLIGNSFQMVFAGHEHLPEVAARNQLEGKETLYVEGGVLKGHGPDDHLSSFNLVRLDLEKATATIRTLQRGSNAYYELISEKTWNFVSRQTVKPYRLLKPDWVRSLNSAGATFRHPGKDGPLELDELFVEPDLVDMEAARETNEIEKIVSPRDLIVEDSIGTKAIIGGPEKSGKSTLLRWLYLRLHARGSTPIRIDGSALPINATERIERIVEQEYLREYDAKSSDVWKQLDKSARAVLVDDFDAAPLNTEGRREFLEALKLRFDIVIVTCDESLIFGSSSADHDFAGLARFQLIEFGHRLRDALIGKWIRIGRSSALEESAFQLMREQRVRAINTLIGTNFVPSRPIFLLTLLQSMEMGLEATVKGSSLGEYYEYLIRHALLGAGVKPPDLDAVQNYLTELGYLLVSGDHASLDSGQLAAFDANFSSRYALRMSFDSLHKQLMNADVLEEWNGQIRFRYKYVLLFFGAKYLARHFGRDQEINEKVRALGQNLHVAKYADLMLFVVHHSNDPAVLDIILEQAKKVFGSLTPLRLDHKDLAPINRLVAEVPALALKDETIEVRRERRMRGRDAARRRRRDEVIADAQNLSLSKLKEQEIQQALDYASELSLSLRILGILGQVLRNYYGSLLAERKAELASESYALVGRVIKSAILAIGEDTEGVVTEVAAALQKSGSQTPDRAQALAAKFVFGLSSFFIFVVIKRASELVGSDKLLPTHEGVSARVDTPLSRLLQLAIKLDYPGTNSTGGPADLPLDTIQSMDQELKTSVCGSWILRRLVIDYLYMFEISYQERQKVCDLLGISVARQRKISLLSHRKVDVTYKKGARKRKKARRKK